MNFKKGKPVNNMNTNLLVIEEENPENENLNAKTNKNSILQKTMYNKFKPDTGADYEDDGESSPRIYQVNNKKNGNNGMSDRFTVTNWNNSNHQTYLPQINIRANNEYDKKMPKMYYH